MAATDYALVLSDGRTPHPSALIDYVSTSSIAVGAAARSPLFENWSRPLVREFDQPYTRKAALNLNGPGSVAPAQGWSWIITAVACSHIEAVLELTLHENDYTFAGPWMRDGIELRHQIVVPAGLTIAGIVDRQRCGPGQILIWLRGFLWRNS